MVFEKDSCWRFGKLDMKLIKKPNVCLKIAAESAEKRPQVNKNKIKKIC